MQSRSHGAELSTLAKTTQHIDVPRENISLLREIGQGEFGVVMEASAVNLPGDSRRVTTVAVKLLKDRSEAGKEAFVQEAARLRPLKHENVCALLAVCFQSEPLLIVLEFMPNGDLKTFLRRVKDEGSIRLEHLLKLSVDASRGFRYLHERRFVHRDLAARNVLLSGTYVAKISDFGMARRVFAKEYYMQGSSASKTQWVLPIRWMAPESYFDATWDMRSDVWMFGVLLWEVFSWAELPWDGLQDGEVMKAIQRRDKLEQPALCPADVYAVMLECWKLDVQSRSSAEQVSAALEACAGEATAELKWPGVLRVVASVDASSKATELAELEVAAESVEFHKVLGSGEFGEVVLGTLTRGGIRTSVAVKTLKAGEGLNADTGEYENLIKVGIIDPAMVTRSALQNAASIAKNILTTECIVADKPEEGGGGMGGMGGGGGMPPGMM